MTSLPFDNQKLTPLHLKFIQLVFDEFVAKGVWPKSRELHVKFLSYGDAWTVADEIGHPMLSLRGDRHDSNAITSLSIDAICRCKGSQEVLELYFKVLNRCIEVYLEKPITPAITSAELNRDLNLTDKESSISCELIKISYEVWRSYSYDPTEKECKIELSPDVTKFKGITNIESYLKFVNEARPKSFEDSKAGSDNSVQDKNHQDKSVPHTIIEAVISVLWRRKLGKVLTFIIGLGLSLFAIWMSLPDEYKRKMLDTALSRELRPSAEAINAGVDIIKSETILDLTAWHDIDDRNPIEVAMRSRNLTLRRLTGSTIEVNFSHSTSGDSLKGAEKNGHILITEGAPVIIANQRMNKACLVTIPIQHLELFKDYEFSYLIRYYNGFQGTTGQWIGEQILYPTRQVTITVKFPTSRPCKKLFLKFVPRTESGYLESYINEADTVINQERTEVEWHISQPELGFAYRIDWEW